MSWLAKRKMVRNTKITEKFFKNCEISESRNSFDFTTIRDSFRQHIHNRRNTESSDLVLLDDHLLQNLKTLKEKTFEILQKFTKVSRSIEPENSEIKKFASFDEFVSFVVNQEEILNSEIWKLEAISNYLDELQHFDTPTDVSVS